MVATGRRDAALRSLQGLDPHAIGDHVPGEHAVQFGVAYVRVGRTSHTSPGPAAIRLECPVRSIPLPSPGVVLGSLVGLAAVLVWRIREARGPVSLKKIIIPPLGMATGFSMFVVPAFRIPWTWAVGAFIVGAVALAYPLLRTSKLVRDGDVVLMQRSNAFFTVILGLAAIRLLARGYFDAFLTVEQSGALFFVLAFGMILHWRVRMLLEYRRFTSEEEQ